MSIMGVGMENKCNCSNLEIATKFGATRSRCEVLEEENAYLRKEIESRNVLLKCNCSLNGSLYLELSRLNRKIERLEELSKKEHNGSIY